MSCCFGFYNEVIVDILIWSRYVLPDLKLLSGPGTSLFIQNLTSRAYSKCGRGTGLRNNLYSVQDIHWVGMHWWEGRSESIWTVTSHHSSSETDHKTIHYNTLHFQASHIYTSSTLSKGKFGIIAPIIIWPSFVFSYLYSCRMV